MLLLLLLLQTLLSGNVTRVSALRYGDAKTLPAIDVHLKDGFDEVPRRMLTGLNVAYNTGMFGLLCSSSPFLTAKQHLVLPLCTTKSLVATLGCG
jgi:hypothetical protein